MQYTISDSVPQDVSDISGLLCSNFFSSPAYSKLTPDEAQGYANLNPPSKIIDQYNDLQKISMLTAKDESEAIVGYLYAIAKPLPGHGETMIACCTRLHASPAFLNTTLEYDLLSLFHHQAQEKGFLSTSCVPSNDHVKKQLVAHGYSYHSDHTTQTLQQQGIIRKTPYMIKIITA